MGFVPDSAQLLSRLPPHLATDLFASAKPVRLGAGKALFLAGDSNNGCYRIEDRLLKVMMVSPSIRGAAAWLQDRLPSCLASSSSPTLARIIYCSVVMVSSNRRGGAFVTPTAPRPASACDSPWGTRTPLSD